MSKSDILGTQKVSTLLLRLALPSVAAQLVSLLYNIVDRIFIGHIAEVGTLALTGAGLFSPISMLLIACADLIGAGGAPMAAIALGEGKTEKSEKILGNCTSAIIILGLVLTIILEIFMQPMMLFFGASESILPYALSYSRIYVAGSIFVMITLGINLFIACQGFSGMSMLTTVIGAIINIILDPIFIFVLNMGVSGAALASVISQAISAVWILSFLTSKKTVLKIKPKNLKPVISVLRPCLLLGISTFVMSSTETLLSIAYNKSLSYYGGDIALGAMTIITSVSWFVIFPVLGVAHGGQPIISYNYGAQKPERVKEAFRLMLITGALYASIFCILLLAFPKVFAGFFSSNEQLVSETSKYMRIYFAGIFAIGFQFVCQQSFVALGQAKISLLLACLRKLILLIPLVLILPVFFEDKVFAIFLAEPISDIIAATFTTTAFFTKFPKILNTNLNSK